MLKQVPRTLAISLISDSVDLDSLGRGACQPPPREQYSHWADSSHVPQVTQHSLCSHGGSSFLTPRIFQWGVRLYHLVRPQSGTWPSPRLLARPMGCGGEGVAVYLGSSRVCRKSLWLLP